MAYWLAVGPPENWRHSLRGRKVWGFPPSHKRAWNQIDVGDAVLFYATDPVKGLIGYGRVLSKFRDKAPLWPQEVKEGTALWPFRIELEVDSCLPQEQWQTAAVHPKRRSLVVQLAVQRLSEARAADFLDSIRGASQ